jgi:hypothetical protein
MTYAVNTQALRPALPKGYRLLQSEFGGYFFEDSLGDGSEDYRTPIAAIRAARRHHKAEKEQALREVLAY